MSLYDDDMRKPLRPRRLRERLRDLAPRPVSLITGIMLIASVVGLTYVIRRGDPLAGEPMVRVAMPSLDVPTASTAPPIDQATTPIENPELAPPLPAEDNFAASDFFAPGQTIVEPIIRTEPETQIRMARAPIPGLFEKGPQGLLPRISPNGRKPALAYARPVEKQALQGPRIILIIGGLGLNDSLSKRALKLPSAITLGVAPYGKELQKFADAARASGHELLLQLPMEPIGYPRLDPGPNTLRAGPDTNANSLRLLWLLSRFQGYFGVTNYLGNRFLTDPQAVGHVRQQLAARGVAWIVPGNATSIDSPDRAMVMRRLSELETKAARGDVAIGVGTGLDVTLDALEEWTQNLETRGIKLVPASSLLAGSSKLLTAQD